MSKRPNILFFLTDDHGAWTLSEYGNKALKTPCFSQLSSNGTLFRNAFTPCPVCSPARACVMTGQTPSQVGIHDWLQEWDEEIDSRDWLSGCLTLPELLRSRGYYTILSGKWHLGRSHFTPRGFDRCFGLPGGQGDHNSLYTYHQDGVKVTLDGNKSENITSRAIDMLEDVPDDLPFFLNVGYIATHSPYEASAHDPELVCMSQELSLGDIPKYIPHPWVKNEGGISCSSNDLTTYYQGYYAAVLELDRNIQRVLSYLKKSGKLENTIVIYTSDHGCAMGHNGFFGKGNSTRPLNMYDSSIRVPLIISGPGVMKSHEVDAHVDHYDLFEAICEWGGVSSTPCVGQSLAALAEGKESLDWPEVVYGEYGDLRMMRTPNYKFINRYGRGPNELFNLKNDPEERCNLSGRSEFESLENAMILNLNSWYSDHEKSNASGLNVSSLPIHNRKDEAWRDGLREKTAGYNLGSSSLSDLMA
ncbi:sulfatase family protein [Cerasicoccus maritimus]|uniref:sulfatase family protein n=1 Tax=Cerasicoccus maritimus TaxID=490089 RepID=UPI002852D07A|nr:sulfatase-like hydrolase/transferase [Cerasicoccus maritimus]